MSKQIELTQSQIKALQSGATMFIIPISDYDLNRIDKGYSIGDSFPIYKGDKNIFVQEEFYIDDYLDIYYKIDDKPVNSEDFILDGYDDEYIGQVPASKMTKEQSRYSFSECIDVRVIRFKDISADNKIIKYIGVTEEDAILYNGWKPTYDDPDSGGRLAWDIAFEEFYNQQMKEQNINRTYEDNDYVFLVEFA